MDNLTTCDRCSSDACYVQEVNNEIKIYHCYGCGFVANSVMKVDSQFLKEQIEVLPELYKELLGEDEETGLVWMPNTVNIPDKGMVFADGANASHWRWAAVKAIPMPEDEKDKFKEKGKDYEWKMDMTTLKHFPERDYMEALDYIKVFE